jgi:membrane fusion protein (multidrug efflux system)
MTTAISEPASPAVAAEAPRSKKPWVAVLALCLAGSAFAVWHVTHRGLETTDNAQVDATIVLVPARTSGTVTHLLFRENQSVKAGDLIAELDDAPAKARLAQADAILASAKASAAAADADAQITETNAVGNRSVAQASFQTALAGVATSEDQVAERQAQVASAESSLAQAKSDRDRMAALFKNGSISKSQMDQADTAYELAQSGVMEAKSRLATQKMTVGQIKSNVVEASAKVKQSDTVGARTEQARARAAAAHAEVDKAQAARDLAALDLSYTKITAPHDGVLSKKSIAEGQLLASGQTIAQLVTPELFVVANLKETQVAQVHTGQPAHFEVDAYPGRVFDGDVESLSGATGARFALLPPDNATGNYTKVVQRVPVRIRVHALPPDVTLRPGMSVDLTIDTRRP